MADGLGNKFAAVVFTMAVFVIAPFELILKRFRKKVSICHDCDGHGCEECNHKGVVEA